jgi:endonuclease YncB( thermonuclease family)
MGADHRIWRRYAARRARQEQNQADRLARVRRRFRAKTRRKPSWRTLAVMGAAVIVTTVPIGTAILMAGRGEHAAWSLNGSVERRLVGPIRIIDGDTIEAEGERIRISNIDTPEKPPRSRCAAEAILAGRATAHLEAMIADGYEVTFTPHLGRERDAYGRLLGRVAVDGLDVGRAQLNAGLAATWRGRKAKWC